MFTTKEEQIAEFRFLAADGVGVHEEHLRMKAVYGEDSLSLICMQYRYKRFRE